MLINPLTAIDFYKADHRRQYPEGTELVYSNFTPRSGHLSNLPPEMSDGTVVFFGLQYFIQHFLIDTFNKEFFQRPKHEVVEQYKRRMDTSLGEGAIPVDHIIALHDLGYLPIEIQALPEGSRVPIKVPVLTIFNTEPRFFWLTNYLETILSCYLWKAITSATTARAYRKLFEVYSEATGGDPSFVKFQGHDFSFRGMSSLQDAALSGAAHLTSFVGTDTVIAIDLLENYYGANADQELVGCSVPATEHSVMCMGTEEAEIETFRRLIEDIYPSGIVSIVSDTWDFWQVMTVYAAQLAEKIKKRLGKVVFRPDSGDPVKILCGDPQATEGTPEHKGAVECLWEIFGGSFTKKGYRQLDPCVGLIYGDSITPARALAIMQGLKAKGFSSTNVVLGIGSFTYQYVTRDTYGFAVKSTYGEVKGKGRAIFKCPKTDDGVKKSARGIIKIVGENGAYSLIDEQEDYRDGGALQPVFRNGMVLRRQNLQEIRERVQS